MALLNEAVEFKKLDVRLIERNMNRGSLTQADLTAAIAKLRDDAVNADWVDLESLTTDTSQE